jgi:hypothetical protein
MAIPNTFGFTRRDVERIKTMAEGFTGSGSSEPLVDLDVPYRVIATEMGRESYFSGEVLGTWAGRLLLVWRMTNREQEVWQRRMQGR